jgi:HEAT repeats
MLRVHAAEYVDELVAEFHRESNRGLRCWLLELIGYARSAHVLPLLVQQLHSQDEALRDWAARGLQLLDTREARQALYQARANGEIA